MVKRIGIIIVRATLVVAHCLIGGAAFADSLTQSGQPCPPECVTDSMEIVTWYPSPYNEYEELRLYPTQRDDNYCDNDKIGLMYYDHGGTPSFPEDDKMKVCKGIALGWQDLGYWQSSTIDTDDIYYNTGNVGIGTTNPEAMLHVKGSSGYGVPNLYSFVSGGVGPGFNMPLLRLRDSSMLANEFWDIYGTDGDLIPLPSFRISHTTGGSTENWRFVIDNNGKVGIGTTNPSQALDVVGEIHATGDICTDAGGGVCLSGSTDCEWIYAPVGLSSNWSTANCPSGKSVKGWHCYTSVAGTDTQTEMMMMPTFFKCRSISPIHKAFAEAYCCR